MSGRDPYWAGYLTRVLRGLQSSDVGRRYGALEAYEDFLDRAVFDRDGAAAMRDIMRDVRLALDRAEHAVSAHLAEYRGDDDVPVQF